MRHQSASIAHNHQRRQSAPADALQSNQVWSRDNNRLLPILLRARAPNGEVKHGLQGRDCRLSIPQGAKNLLRNRPRRARQVRLLRNQINRIGRTPAQCDCRDERQDTYGEATGHLPSRESTSLALLSLRCTASLALSIASERSHSLIASGTICFLKYTSPRCSKMVGSSVFVSSAARFSSTKASSIIPFLK